MTNLGDAWNVRPGTRVLWLAVTLSASLTAAGCGGGGGSDNGDRSGAGGGSTLIPTLDLTASPTSVSAGGSSTLSWNADNVDSCDASAGWSGDKATSGSQTVGPINTATDYRLSCQGANGGVSKVVTVTVDQGNGPSITFNAQPAQIAPNEKSTLNWSTQDATDCDASGGPTAWQNSAPGTSGTFDTGALTQSTTYSLSCTGQSGNALASVTVEVLDKTLRWQAPTANVDGSAVNLGGFNVYWSKQSGSYPASPQHVINDPNATQWDVTGIQGTYYFVLTAFDVNNSESAYSNEVQKTIP